MLTEGIKPNNYSVHPLFKLRKLLGVLIGHDVSNINCMPEIQQKIDKVRLNSLNVNRIIYLHS